MLSFFFFNDTATTEIYTLSLHDALPIYPPERRAGQRGQRLAGAGAARREPAAGVVHPPAGRSRGGRGAHARRTRRSGLDRKSTRLNSSHANISYAVFCLKKKKITKQELQ